MLAIGKVNQAGEDDVFTDVNGQAGLTHVDVDHLRRDELFKSWLHNGSPSILLILPDNKGAIMNALAVATENLDTFERVLAQAMWQRGGIVLREDMVNRVCNRIPRHVDASGRDEPLLMTKDALQTSFADQGLTVDDRRCFEIAQALLPYIAVTDSNLE
jgi:hypothetical protein